MKKSIGVITFHKTYNYGAALQAYATVRLLGSFGFDTKIIDYYPNNLSGYGTFKNSFNEASNQNRNILGKTFSALIKTPSYRLLKKRFDDFVENYLPITKPYYSSDELRNSLPDCVYFCTGSDQVWNNYYTHYFEGAFFLDFVPDGHRCFSIASSFGKESFSTEELEYIEKQLKRYDYISVREKSGINIVNRIGIDKVDLMPDPTILADKETWTSFLKHEHLEQPYILVYQLHGDSNAFDLAKQFGKQKKIKVVRIITMFHQIRPGCTNIIVPSVEDFVGLFADAEYVFTDSFHGTVFSHLFGKKIGISLPSKFSDRIITFLDEAGTMNYIVKDLHAWEAELSNIDYTMVWKQIDSMRESGISKLQKYLNTL